MGVKRLYATTDLTEAELLRALLRDQGIESSLDNSAGAALAVGLPTAAVPIGINVSAKKRRLADLKSIAPPSREGLRHSRTIRNLYSRNRQHFSAEDRVARGLLRRPAPPMRRAS